MASDEELMERTATGDKAAFGELVRRHQQSAWSTAYRLLHDASEAENIAQEAFLKIFRNADNYRPTAAFTTYLTRVVTRLCYDRWEKYAPDYVDPDSDLEPAPETENPLGELVQSEEKSAVREALSELPDRQRVAVVLNHFENNSYREIAEVLESTEKAVERLLARGRRKLREKLETYL